MNVDFLKNYLIQKKLVFIGYQKLVVLVMEGLIK